jgi:hypothetical protein
MIAKYIDKEVDFDIFGLLDTSLIINLDEKTTTYITLLAYDFTHHCI